MKHRTSPGDVINDVTEDGPKEIEDTVTDEFWEQ